MRNNNHSNVICGLDKLCITPRKHMGLYMYILDHGTGDEWSAPCPCRITPRETAHGTHSISWVGPRVGLDLTEAIKFLAPTGNRTLTLQPVAIQT
jgi:hypothetical protein